MTRRLDRSALTAASLLALDAAIRLGVGEAYAGATFLLLVACGLALQPLLPNALATLSLRLAVLPALAIGSFSILLTTVSVVGIPLTELSIRLAVAALVVVVALVAPRILPREDGEPAPTWSWRRETLALAVLAGLLAFSLASSWDVAYPLQARGTDWGHYLLYADEVAVEERLLIDDPLAGDDRVFADPSAVGALYGSFRILGGVSSWALGFGIVVVSGLTVLTIYAAGGGLWGAGAGIAAAAAYAVAPIRLDPLYWHGLGTTLALVFVPLVVLAIGLAYRGDHDRRTVVLLGLSLASVAAAHSTSAIVAGVLFVVGFLIAAALRRDAVVTLVAGGATACVLGAGVIVHLALQAADLGRPVDYRFLDPHWLNGAAVGGYFSWEFLALAGVGVVLVLSSRTLRRDPALLAVASLALACVVVSQLWRLHVPFEYRRSVYYLGAAMALVIGLGLVRLVRLGRGAVWIGAYALALAYVAHLSVGLRLPERVLSGPEPRSAGVSGLVTFHERLESGELPDTSLLVADACLHFSVPYMVRRPTIPAFGERQVGFVERLPLARKAATILAGGAEGGRLAAQLGVQYVVADPGCEPGLAERLGGTVVVENAEVVVVRLPPAA